MAYTFMIVDDSIIVRKVLAKTLHLTNLPIGEILEAEHGGAALDLLKSNWVDLLFLDINMPVMNGMEFMERLVADEELKDTAVIVISTEGCQERIDRLQELGVKAYLRKPVTPESVTNAVVSLLEGGK